MVWCWIIHCSVSLLVFLIFIQQNFNRCTLYWVFYAKEKKKKNGLIQLRLQCFSTLSHFFSCHLRLRHLAVAVILRDFQWFISGWTSCSGTLQQHLWLLIYLYWLWGRQSGLKCVLNRLDTLLQVHVSSHPRPLPWKPSTPFLRACQKSFVPVLLSMHIPSPQYNVVLRAKTTHTSPPLSVLRLSSSLISLSLSLSLLFPTSSIAPSPCPPLSLSSSPATNSKVS